MGNMGRYMQRKINFLLLVVGVLALHINKIDAAPIGDLTATNLNYGGSLLQHDMMMIKEQQKQYEEKMDFGNFHERKSKRHKKEDVIQDNTTEKIYTIESSQEFKKQDEEAIRNFKENSKKRFFKKKNKEELYEILNNQEINKTKNKTKIEAKTTKTDIQNGKVRINAVSVTNSNILTTREIQELSDKVIGQYVSFVDLEKLIQDFNYLYATKGYVTAKAVLPPQKIESGIIKITLIEGTVGEIKVSNNRYTSSRYITKRISQKENSIFKITDLEQDIVAFNKYNEGIKLKANLEKGSKQGTTDINIVAKEKFPFHIVGTMDNAGRKTIGELRGGLMLFSDSLFKQRDRLTVGAYASSHSVTPFADYNIPINRKDGRLGFTFSSSYAEIAKGPYKIFDIASKSYNYSLYYTHPLIRRPFFELNSYSAMNYKEAETEFGGYSINKDKISSFETSLNARWDTKRGIWYISQGAYQAFPIFDEASRYFKYTGNITRLHDFGHGIVGQFRGMYQYSPKDVMPYIDQFQAGGLATIRGYSEGLLIGRSGYLMSAELMYPIAPQEIKIKTKKDGKIAVPFLGKYVKGVAFVDHAGIYPYKGDGPGKESYDSSDYMISMGLGLRIQLPGEATARLYWGFPLMHNRHETDYKRCRLSFSLSLAPDFDKLLEYRKSRKAKENL